MTYLASDIPPEVQETRPPARALLVRGTPISGGTRIMRWRPTSLRWNSVVVTLSLLIAAVVAQVATTAAPALATGSGSATFSYTGSNQSWTVPSGVTSIGVDRAVAGCGVDPVAGSWARSQLPQVRP